MRDVRGVRTTLELDDDVLEAAKEIATNRGSTAGQVISELARKGLATKVRQGTRNGVPLMPRRRKGTRRPTMQEVNRLRDE